MNDIRNFVDTVKERIDISEVIGRYVKLDGHNKGICPFHTDTNPSLSINSNGQYFKCFGCGRGGDVFRFLELHEGMSFIESLRMLAGEIGMDLPSFTDEERLAIAKQKEIDSILNHAAWYHHQQLSPDAKEYLINTRGFNEDTLKRHQVGYGDGTLGEYLIDGCNKFPGLCIDAGVLVKVRADYKDHFAGRIVFPNIRRGQVVHMSGRALGDIEPRHLHLKGEIRHLYNEDDLRYETVVLTEGIPDCLSVIQAGFPAVAVLGTSSFKPEFIDRFSRCKTVYVAMDNDEPGLKAALEIGPMLGRKARIVQIPVVNDLNEYLLHHTPDDFRGLLKEAKDFIRYRIFQIPGGIDKTELHDQLEPVLRDLAALNKPLAEAYLGRDIKDRFDLNAAEVSAYRSQIAGLREEQIVAQPIARADIGESVKMTALFSGLVDLVDDNGKVAFLVKENETLVVLHEVVRDGQKLIPPPAESIHWLLPRATEVMGFYNSSAMADGSYGTLLYRELVEYHKSISDLPSDEYYSFFACWVMHTYLLEQAQYSPILCFSALPARGKTRTCKGLIYVAYRGLYEQSLREANIFRFANGFQGTMCFDIRDFWKKVEYCQSDDLFLNRFEKGGGISRTLFPDRNDFEAGKWFLVFGPTIISTNEPIHEILETRSITLNMRDAVRVFNKDVKPENALSLREKLLAFRAKYLDVTLPQVVEKPASCRLGDLLRPIQQVLLLVNPEGNEEFLRFAEQLGAERQATAVLDPIAQIASAVVESREKVDRGILAVKDVTEKVNEGRADRFHISPQRVGRNLRTMGLKACCTGNGSSAYLWDEGVIAGLKQRYGLE